MQEPVPVLQIMCIFAQVACILTLLDVEPNTIRQRTWLVLYNDSVSVFVYLKKIKLQNCDGIHNR